MMNNLPHLEFRWYPDITNFRCWYPFVCNVCHIYTSQYFQSLTPLATQYTRHRYCCLTSFAALQAVSLARSNMVLAKKYQVRYLPQNRLKSSASHLSYSSRRVNFEASHVRSYIFTLKHVLVCGRNEENTTLP